LDLIQFNQWDLQVSPGQDVIPVFLSGPAFTLFKDGKIVAIGGVARLWNGVGEAWTIPANGMAHPLLFHRTIKRMIETIEKAEGFHRIQAVVMKSHLKAHKWIKKLGFEDEGKMTSYGPHGEDFIRYARVKWPG